MYYEINVSKKFKGNMGTNYKHLFATAPRSITDREELKTLYNEFKLKFPEPLYKITITYHPESSKIINPDELDN